MAGRKDKRHVSILLVILGLAGAQGVRDDTDFFENRIRPVLVERCYRCHNSASTSKGRLALDHREALREGGRRGPAVVPGRPEDSLLVQAIRRQAGAPRMPKDEPKLEPSVVADFVEWIRRGAMDPRDRPPSAEDLEKATSWDAVREERKKWWSFPSGGSAHRSGHRRQRVRDRDRALSLRAARLRADGRARRAGALHRQPDRCALQGVPRTHRVLRTVP